MSQNINQNVYFHSGEWTKVKAGCAIVTCILGGLIVATAIAVMILNHQGISLSLGHLHTNALSSKMLDGMIVGGGVLLAAVLILTIHTQVKAHAFKKNLSNGFTIIQRVWKEELINKTDQSYKIDLIFSECNFHLLALKNKNKIEFHCFAVLSEQEKIKLIERIKAKGYTLYSSSQISLA